MGTRENSVKNYQIHEKILSKRWVTKGKSV